MGAYICPICGEKDYVCSHEPFESDIADLQRQLAEAQAERDSLRAVVAQVNQWACDNDPWLVDFDEGHLDAILASQPKVLAVVEGCSEGPGWVDNFLEDSYAPHSDTKVTAIIIERGGE